MNEALWAIIGVTVGALIPGLVTIVSQRRQFAHEKEMFLLQNKSAEMVKSILNEMLNHRSYVDRSFDALAKAVGGYSENEIRQFLHELGARKTSRNDGTKTTEWWYLAAREEERRNSKLQLTPSPSVSGR